MYTIYKLIFSTIEEFSTVTMSNLIYENIEIVLDIVALWIKN